MSVIGLFMGSRRQSPGTRAILSPLSKRLAILACPVELQRAPGRDNGGEGVARGERTGNPRNPAPLAGGGPQRPAGASRQARRPGLRPRPADAARRARGVVWAF